MSWVWIFGSSAFYAVLGAIFSLFGWNYGMKKFSPMRDSASRADLIAGIVTLVVLVPVNLFFFGLAPPVFAGAGWVMWFFANMIVVFLVFTGFNMVEERKRRKKVNEAKSGGYSYRGYDEYRVRDASVSGTTVVSLLLVLFIAAGPLWLWNNWFTGQDNAKFLASQLKVQMVANPNEQDNYPKTDEQHMVIVGEQNARLTAYSVLGQQNIGTRFNLADGELQSVDGHMFYIFALDFKTKTAADDAGRTVPGYIKVDAEDQNAPAQLVTGYKIKFWKGGLFETSLDRHVYRAYPAHFVDDLSLEIDDSGKPFYTATLNKPIVRWFQSAPSTFITVNAESGEITEYPLDKIPAWADRGFSAQTAKELLNWWGRYAKADYSYSWEAPADRFQVSGDLNLVYTDEGPAWQALMSSLNDDVAVQYVALMSTRTLDVRMYQAPTGLLTENRAADAFQTSANNLKRLDPTSMALHKVYGKLVWVASMVADGRGGQKGDDGYPTREAFAGIGVLDATNSDSTAALFGGSKGEVFGKLAQQIATGGNNADPTAGGQTKQVQGTVAVAQAVVENGNTLMLIRLEGEEDVVYLGPVITNKQSSLLMAVAKPGDVVTIGYLDKEGGVRNIASFDTVKAADAAAPPVVQPTPGG